MNTVWDWVERASALVGLVSLPYLVVSYRRRSPRFSFTFLSRSREFFERDNMECARLLFDGTIKNQSLDANTIERLYIVVWRNGRKGYRTFGYVPTKITEHGKALHQPIAFAPRQARTLHVEFEITLTGSHEMNLIHALETLPGPLGLALPKYQYELVFEDVLGNLFDEQGQLRNRKGADLRWTLDNAIEQAKDGKVWPLVKHVTLIYSTDFVFMLRRWIRKLGV